MGSGWGTPVEQERRNRIRLSVAAWAYESHSASFLTDDEFDRLAEKIDPSMSTGNRKLDNFFKKHFHPHTGQWVHKHPDRRGLERLWQLHYKDLAK